MDRAAFIRSVLGRPYDKQEFNCWHLVLQTQLILAGRTLPAAEWQMVNCLRTRAHAMAQHHERASWRQVEEPRDCALVLMSRQGGQAIHAGTWLHEDGGAILHTNKPHGVVLDNLLEVVQVRGWCASFLVPADA